MKFKYDSSGSCAGRKELKMAVIAVGSRPETSNVTKFFELVGVDKRLNEGIKRLRVVY